MSQAAILPDVEVAGFLDEGAVYGFTVAVRHVDCVVYGKQVPLRHTHRLRLRVQLGLNANSD